METPSNVICLCLHVAIETEHGLLMVNDLVIAFVYALTYCAEVIYNLMEGSPRKGPLFCLIVPWGKEKNFAPKKRGDKERKNETNKNTWIEPSENHLPNAFLPCLGPCVLCFICSQNLFWVFYVVIIIFS